MPYLEAPLASAVELRRAGVPAPVLSWLNPVGADFETALVFGVELAVFSTELSAAVVAAATATQVRARVHLHVDVGMAGEGAPPRAWADLCLAALRAERSGAAEVTGVMGHLGGAGDAGNVLRVHARRRFEEALVVAGLTGLRPRLRHLAATAATLTAPATHFDMCRAGAGLVGIDPSGTTALRPAATLTAPVVSVRDVSAGSYVGYGCGHLTGRRTRALLALGYAGGIPRMAAELGEVQLRGRRCPLLGSVAMDHMVVDVDDEPVGPGKVAVIFGPGSEGEPTAAAWASWAGTVEHNVVTGIGRRVVRRTLATPQQLCRVGTSRTTLQHAPTLVP